jgi:hypothetical protein
MSIAEAPTYSTVLKEALKKKSSMLSKAQAFFEIGLVDTAQPLFLSAAVHEERIAALFEIDGRELEAAVHRISAASCYAKADHLSQAITLYRAALSGPLTENVRQDVFLLLTECIDRLAQKSATDWLPSAFESPVPV